MLYHIYCFHYSRQRGYYNHSYFSDNKGVLGACVWCNLLIYSEAEPCVEAKLTSKSHILCQNVHKVPFLMHLDSVPNERVSGWLVVCERCINATEPESSSVTMATQESIFFPHLVFHPNLDKEGYQSSVKKMDRESEISQKDKTIISKVVFFFKQSIDKLTAQI